MNTKFLCIAIVLLTTFIIGGNQYSARSERSEENCPDCGCSVQLLITLSDANKKKEPSCSLVFKLPSKPFIPEKEGEEELAPLPGAKVTERLTDQPTRLSACQSAVFCDKSVYATIKCDGADIAVNASKKCSITCQANGILVVRCNHWARKRPKTAPTSGRSPSEFSSLWSEFLGATKPATSLKWGFLPAKYSEPTDDTEAREIITGSNRWRLIDGEAGIEEGAVFVPSGEAKVQNFCTGDTVRAVGPSVISLPVCDVDVSGRWRGAYVRRLTDGSLKSLAVVLNLRKESGSLRGELTTPNGAFNIVEASQSGSDIWLRAEGKVAGTTGKIELRGTLTKGDIAFDGSEQSADSKTTYGLTGLVRRLYVADGALPIAILNQPYSFALTAFSPESQAITLRLANPAAKQPEKITWTTAAESLRGRNGQRFTYLCPANGTLNRSLYRGNAYTIDSSICTAAVNSHVINQQAGGVVTIQIQPGPSPDTGRFVLVSAEPQGGERGRLPRGLSFDGNSGTFSGTPTELGSFEIIVVADDGAGNVFEQPLTLVVKKLVVTNGLLPDGFVGQPYAATLKVAGGQPPYRFSGTPPKGLQLDPITGELSGRPSSPGPYSSFEVTVRDSQNISESQKLRLSVRVATILNSYFLPDAVVGVPYRTQFQAVGKVTPISWLFDRPDASSIGLALNEGTGELSGTPTTAGNFFFEVRAQGGSSVPSRRFALTIK